MDIGKVKYVVLDFLKLKITLFWRAITARRRKNLFQVVKLLLTYLIVDVVWYDLAFIHFVNFKFKSIMLLFL